MRQVQIRSKPTPGPGFFPGGGTGGVPPSSENFANPPPHPTLVPVFGPRLVPPPAEVRPRKFEKFEYIFVSNLTTFKVGVNHGFFHVYHFWNFLIFKCTWVCSSSSSKNKSIFLNLSINSVNLKMSITWVFQKCVHLYFRGEIKLARV